MINYIPFLKLKSNEVAALKELEKPIKSKVVPFFDIAKKRNMNSDQLKIAIVKNSNKVKTHLKDFDEFYIDSYDIDDSLLINADHNYRFIISEFKETNFIPVVGLDRTNYRNSIVFDEKRAGKISSGTIALRLQADDFENFALSEFDIFDVIDQGKGLFDHWDVILDNRMCRGINTAVRARSLAKFINDLTARMEFNRIIITGSSLTASIGEIIATEDDLHHPRTEIEIYSLVKSALPDFNLTLGDYTVVSPLYSDIDIPLEAMRSVTTAKITYSYKDMHYISRGGSLKSHPRGDLQYNDIAKDIISMAFYRGIPYSFGDGFLNDKALFKGTKVTAGSILKPTINLHITYMAQDFPA